MKRLAVLAGLGAWLAGAAARADLAFTSVPPTSAAVGQAYAYEMTAAVVSDDDDDDGRSNRRIRFIPRALPSWLEFDGRDTIFGTPRPEDLGEHRVRLRARIRGDHADQEFTIVVAAAPSGPPREGTDLAASLAVTPDEVAPGAAATFDAAARNLSDVDVANFVLETAFSGIASLTIDGVDDPGCSIESRVDHTAVVCRWSPLLKGTSRSVQIGFRSNDPGEALAIARVSIADAVPVDRNARNDEAQVVLNVTDSPGDPDPSAGAPVLTLKGDSTMTITVGEPYQDPGATAMDDVDGDLTSKIVVDNPVDSAVIGRYSVTYDVVDSAGNLSTATRIVEVVPRAPSGGGGGGAAGGMLLLLLACALLARLASQPPSRPAPRRQGIRAPSPP